METTGGCTAISSISSISWPPLPELDNPPFKEMQRPPATTHKFKTESGSQGDLILRGRRWELQWNPGNRRRPWIVVTFLPTSIQGCRYIISCFLRHLSPAVKLASVTLGIPRRRRRRRNTLSGRNSTPAHSMASTPARRSRRQQIAPSSPPCSVQPPATRRRTDERPHGCAAARSGPQHLTPPRGLTSSRLPRHQFEEGLTGRSRRVGGRLSKRETWMMMMMTLPNSGPPPFPVGGLGFVRRLVRKRPRFAIDTRRRRSRGGVHDPQSMVGDVHASVSSHFGTPSATPGSIFRPAIASCSPRRPLLRALSVR